MIHIYALKKFSRNFLDLIAGLSFLNYFCFSMRDFILLLLTVISFGTADLYAQSKNQKSSMEAVRISQAPSIDGYLDDVAWQQAKATTGFTQKDPVHNAPPRFNTEVRIVYDDKAIYVAAYMFDPNPDSIRKQLAVRDSDGMNADFFYVRFDTYHNKQDSYNFGVSASGFQLDSRAVDETYDAVWSSAVRIAADGWIAEFRIPYSALRFPAIKEQEWGLQISRSIRRYREEDQWSLEPRDVDNVMNYWGTLTGLSDIEPPLRLSVLPYLSAGIQHNGDAELESDEISYKYNGGMDLKWGLNESFTLDMILMPDFSQVQSDEVENNLSPFELVYDENRPFFNEGTDLFHKGDLFYSRRIGHVPISYSSADDSLQPGEYVVSNPYSSRLLNAMKLSGRTSSGLGIGVFNAITANTYAEVADSAGNKRNILTDPLTNYNILVLDQSLPNNSSLYLINNNVIRPDGWRRSNVTGGGFKLSEKSNSYRLQFDLSLTSVHDPSKVAENGDTKNNPGSYYYVGLQKIRGKLRFSLYQIAMNQYYDRNDLGVNNTNDWLDRGLTLGYNIFEPFGVFRNFYQSINFFREQQLTTDKNINSLITYQFNTTLTNYLSLWGSTSYSPFERYDYYEPRVTGRVWILPGYYSANLGFSSDYRKTLALDGEIQYSKELEETCWTFFGLSPIIRLSDKFKVTPSSELQLGRNDKGFVYKNYPLVYFGKRNIQTFTNSILGEYMFNNNISLSMRVRHYWQKGDYINYYLLSDEGRLLSVDDYPNNHDYNYNYFNIDFVFGWEFSPGSMINVVWKNVIEQQDALNDTRYFNNFDRMINSPQVNNLSVKVLYYLDYQMLRRKR